MFPYKRRLTWLVKSRWLHLADAMATRPQLMKGDRGGRIRRRVRGLRFWNTIRGVATLLLSAGILASIALWVAEAIQTTDDLQTAAETGIRLFRQISNALAGAAALIYLFATRILGQLEIDILFLAGIKPAGAK